MNEAGRLGRENGQAVASPRPWPPPDIDWYYADEYVAIACGDCRDVLPKVEARSVDLVLGDPPFSIPVKYHNANGDFPRSWGDLSVMEPFFMQVFRSMRHVVKDAGQTYVCCDADSYPIFYKVAMSFWPQSHLIVWYKPTGRRGRGFLHSHELLLHLRTTQTIYSVGFRQDVIGIMPVRTLNREHPAEKPIDLLSFLIDIYPRYPMMICDPFIGSGTTLVAAKQLGHKAIGIEISEQYCDIAIQRLAQVPMIFDEPEPEPEQLALATEGNP